MWECSGTGSPGESLEDARGRVSLGPRTITNIWPSKQ